MSQLSCVLMGREIIWLLPQYVSA